MHLIQYYVTSAVETVLYDVRSQVLTAARMKMRAFWDIALYSLVGVD
jgi:hypothetical protein